MEMDPFEILSQSFQSVIKLGFLTRRHSGEDPSVVGLYTD
jgi:hypothetical protein